METEKISDIDRTAGSRRLPTAGRPPALPKAALLLAGLLPCASFAQGYPSKPVRFIVRAPPGGTDDLIARLMQPALTKTLGQSVVIDYKPGAGGLVAWEYLAKQPADGYSMLLAASGLAGIKSLRSDAALDPFRDIAWVSEVTNFMLVMLAHPSLPARTIPELTALAKKRPGELSYGSSGIAATPHLAAEYFKAAAKIDINHVPYKGAGPMYVDLVGGRLELGSAVLGAALPHIRSGKVRPLGVSGAKRSDQMPELPTIGETLPGFAFEPFYAMVMAAGTPRELQNAMADAIAKAMTAPEFKANFLKIVGSPVVVNRPEQMLDVAKKEAVLIERIVKTAGIKLE
jgi:tripartite-type tricarboxylate transporter receptor subunit TctC